ncbi:hypothetical protein BASA81_016253 [Batrachochytrium salamandrivorans]|nr:hypothetical protein BASA81_016253 [Batrachochytrium salamandrivorans]
MEPIKRSRFTSEAPPVTASTTPPLPVTAPKLKIKKKIYPSVNQYPQFDFVKLIEVEKESIQRDTLAVISMRGMGSGHLESEQNRDPLHVLVEAEREDQANRAEALVREVLADPNKLPEPVLVPPSQLSLRQSVFGTHHRAQHHSTSGGNLGRVGDFQKEIRVPEEVAGGVIGKAGETVKRLQHESGARIQIAREESTSGLASEGYRIISIRAPTQEIVDLAEEMVRQVITNRGQFGESTTSSVLPSTLTEHLHIPSSRAGAVIGRQGANIKNIQQRFNCKITIPSNFPNTPANSRTLQICADTREQIDLVKEEIGLIVDSKQSVFVDDQGTAVRIPDDKAGLIIGKQGCTIKAIQERLQVRIQIPNQPDPGTNYRTASVSGRTPESVQFAVREIEQILAGEVLTNSTMIGTTTTVGTAVPNQDYSAQWVEYYKQLDALPQEQRELAYAALREHHQRQQQQ